MRATVREAVRGAQIGAACAGLALLLPTSTAGAASLALPDTPYTYTVIDQDLAAALQEFGSNLRVKVNISPEVKGRIQGRIPEGSAKAFLERLAANYNLEWYYDGNVLYLTSARENRSQLLVLSPIPLDSLKRALDALQISDTRFPVRQAPGNGVVMVSGPPRYVALVEQTLGGLVAEEQARPKPVAALPKPPEPPKAQVFTVFRGGQMTVFRDGRPERLIGPEIDSPSRAELPPSFAAGPSNGPGAAPGMNSQQPSGLGLNPPVAAPPQQR